MALLSSVHLTDLASRQFLPRKVLPTIHHSVWRVETGVARSITWLEDGTVITLGLWGAGEVIHQTRSLEPFQIECLTKVEATPISNPQQLETAALLAYVQQLEELAIIRSHKRVDAMMLKLLDWLANRFGRDVEAGRMIDFRLTHQDIAELLGTTRVTVTRTLSQFEQNGLIDRISLGRTVVKSSELWHYEI